MPDTDGDIKKTIDLKKQLPKGEYLLTFQDIPVFNTQTLINYEKPSYASIVKSKVSWKEDSSLQIHEPTKFSIPKRKSNMKIPSFLVTNSLNPVVSTLTSKNSGHPVKKGKADQILQTSKDGNNVNQLETFSHEEQSYLQTLSSSKEIKANQLQSHRKDICMLYNKFDLLDIEECNIEEENCQSKENTMDEHNQTIEERKFVNKKVCHNLRRLKTTEQKEGKVKRQRKKINSQTSEELAFENEKDRQRKGGEAVQAEDDIKQLEDMFNLNKNKKTRNRKKGHNQKRGYFVNRYMQTKNWAYSLLTLLCFLFMIPCVNTSEYSLSDIPIATHQYIMIILLVLSVIFMVFFVLCLWCFFYDCCWWRKTTQDGNNIKRNHNSKILKIEQLSEAVAEINYSTFDMINEKTQNSNDHTSKYCNLEYFDPKEIDDSCKQIATCSPVIFPISSLHLTSPPGNSQTSSHLSPHTSPDNESKQSEKQERKFQDEIPKLTTVEDFISSFKTLELGNITILKLFGNKNSITDELNKKMYVKDSNYTKHMRFRKIASELLPLYKKERIVQEIFHCKNCEATIYVSEEKKYCTGNRKIGLFASVIKVKEHEDGCPGNQNSPADNPSTVNKEEDPSGLSNLSGKQSHRPPGLPDGSGGDQHPVHIQQVEAQVLDLQVSDQTHSMPQEILPVSDKRKSCLKGQRVYLLGKESEHIQVVKKKVKFNSDLQIKTFEVEDNDLPNPNSKPFQMSENNEELQFKSQDFLLAVKEMFGYIEQVLKAVPLMRQSSITLTKVKNQVQYLSRKDWNERTFRGIITIDPHSYYLCINEKEICLSPGESTLRLTPTVMKKRRQEFDRKLRVEQDKDSDYIKLTNLPRRKEEIYKGAKEVINECILPEPTNDETNADEYFYVNKELQDLPKNVIDKMRKTIQRNKVRQKMLKEHEEDWENVKLEKTTRSLYLIFKYHHKKSIPYETIVEKLMASNSKDRQTIEETLNTLRIRLPLWINFIEVNSEKYIKLREAFIIQNR